jgi:dTDP-4-amino-4,6-dideoxygalactose transaminase
MTNTARRIRDAAPKRSRGSENVLVLRPHGNSKPESRHIGGNGALANREEPIPVLRPQLPAAADLLPYLQRIDASRVYSNWGPLVQELSVRLGAAFGAPSDGVVCANSGSSALVGAILASAGRAHRDRPLAVVPDFTFTATGLSALLCGYEVARASCGSESWTFTPEQLLARPELLRNVGLVIPVAPFGRVIAQDEWLRFRKLTGIPVIIDGAACFEAFMQSGTPGLGPLPVAMSFHATKTFTTGEGGCVVTTDRSLGFRVLQCLNFGFVRSRNSEVFGINGKMCEYGAAMGLACFDKWHEQTKNSAAVLRRYLRVFEDCGIQRRIWGAPEISSSYILLECRSRREASQIAARLASERIDTRLWYGDGLGGHDVFRDTQKLDLHGRNALQPRRLLGLPVAPDLQMAQIRRIGACVAAALA